MPEADSPLDLTPAERTDVADGFREFSKWFAELAQSVENNDDEHAAHLMTDIFGAMHSLNMDAVSEEPISGSIASQRMAKLFFPEGDDPETIEGAMHQLRRWGSNFLTVPMLHEDGKTDQAGQLAIKTVRQIYMVLAHSISEIERTFPGTKIYVAAHGDCEHDDLHAHGGIFTEEAPVV